MASKLSQARSVRLPNEIWRQLEWVRDNEGERVNDIIKAAVQERLEQYQILEPAPVDGQLELFGEEV